MRLVQFREGLNFSTFTLGDGTEGVVFKASVVDIEQNNVDERRQEILSLIKDLGAKETLRTRLEISVSSNEKLKTFRSAALSDLGFIRYDLYLVIERRPSSIGSIIRTFTGAPIEDIDSWAKGINVPVEAEPVSKAKFLDLFPAEGAFSQGRFSIDGLHTAVLTLKSPTSNEIYKHQLEGALLNIQPPLSVQMSCQPLDPSLSEMTLRRQKSLHESGGDEVGIERSFWAQKALKDLILNGEGLYKVQLNVVFHDPSIEALRQKVNASIRALRAIGDWDIEGLGALPVFNSLSPGEPITRGFKEIGASLDGYAPIYFPSRTVKGINVSCVDTLSFHRVDESLDSLSVFNPLKDNFSICIFGKSGTGKSVLTNLLTESLAQVPSTTIIKVDVGGSHSKETERLGGREFRLSLDKPSGLNPFGMAAEAYGSGHEKTVLMVMGQFLSSLLLEESEVSLPKMIRSGLEEELKRYFDSRPASPSIDGFVESEKELPRKSLLLRWCSAGVFGNAFRSDGVGFSDYSLSYFNFSDIYQAGDKDFAFGGFSALMATFNLVMAMSRDRKFVFIADETPFFISKNFEFFKFSTANVRKFGGSFITIAQKSSDVVIDGDEGIIFNSDTKILFSIDGSEDVFSRRLGITTQGLERTRTLKKSKMEFSEALIKDYLGERVMRIRLSREEYWRFTSSRSDNTKIDQLLGAVEGLTRSEAIRCLAR